MASSPSGSAEGVGRGLSTDRPAPGICAGAGAGLGKDFWLVLAGVREHRNSLHRSRNVQGSSRFPLFPIPMALMVPSR